MADVTQAQLVIRVLQKLHVLNAGETVEAEDSALIIEAIVAVNEKLRDLEIAHWSDTAFPQSVKEDLATYIACHSAGDYMGAEEALGFRQGNEDRALANLRRLTASRERVDAPTKADYF